MNIGDAINRVEDLLIALTMTSSETADNKYQYTEAIMTITNEIRKSIPSKVEYKGEDSPALCPACGTALSMCMGNNIYSHHIWLKCCPNKECHQVLDWEEYIKK